MDRSERNNDTKGVTSSRRAFLRNGTLLLTAAAIDHATAARLLAGPQDLTQAANASRALLRVGLVTDLHHADKPPAGTRHYRETIGKLAEAVEQFEKDQPEIVVELGDFIDAADTVEAELANLKTVFAAFEKLPGEKHFVLGNHCVHTLTKQEFLSEVGQKQAHHSFNAGGWHFVVLDACYRADGVAYGRKNFEWTDTFIPEAELDWLREDLQVSAAPTIVFVHQRLDVDNHYGVKNAADVRAILEEATAADQPAVRAVFQGHSHANDLKEINGIPYCTLVAMVEGSGAENNGYSTLEILEDGSLRLNGFRKQESREWNVPQAQEPRFPATEILD